MILLIILIVILVIALIVGVTYATYKGQGYGKDEVIIEEVNDNDVTDPNV